MNKETMSDAVVRAIGPDAAKEFAKFVDVADSLPGLPAVQPQPLETEADNAQARAARERLNDIAQHVEPRD